MTDIPKPKTSDERVFVSSYRFDTLRVGVVKYLIPAMGVFVLVAFPWWCWKFQQAFSGEIPPEARTQLHVLLGTLLVMGVTIALLFFWVSLNLRRRFFDTFVIYNDEGIRFLSGCKEIGCRWEEIRELKPSDAGRMQTATIIAPKGRFTIDASLFNAQGPRPTVKMGLFGESMLFPNGDVAPMKIRENELFGVIERKLAALEKGSQSSA